MKNKKLVTLIGSVCIAVLLLSTLLACAKQQAPAPSPTPAAKTELPRPTLKIGTSQVGTNDHAGVAVFAPLLEQTTGMTVRVIAEGVEAIKQRRIGEGYFDMIACATPELADCQQGEGSYVASPKFDYQVVWFYQDGPYSYCVRTDSGIKTMEDLDKKGLRVSVNAASPTMMKAMEDALTAWYGYPHKTDRWTWVYSGSPEASRQAVMNGTADVCMMATTGATAVEWSASPQGVTYLPMPVKGNEDRWARFLKVFPSMAPGTALWGVKPAIGIPMYMIHRQFWSIRGVNDDLDYFLAKWFNEHYNEYKGGHVACERMSLENFRSSLDVLSMPVSAGTVKYLKEIGKWTASDDTWNADGRVLMRKYIDAWNKASAEAQTKKVEITNENKDWIAIWQNAITGIPPFTSRLK